MAVSPVISRGNYLRLNHKSTHEDTDMRPPLEVHWEITPVLPPILIRGSAVPAPSDETAAHVHPDPLPACQANGSRLHHFPPDPAHHLSRDWLICGKIITAVRRFT